MKREQRIDYVFDKVLLAYDITTARRQAGLSQDEVSKLIGVQASTVGRWEQRRGDAPRISNLLSICNLFDLNPHDYWCLQGTQARDVEHARHIRRDGCK